MGKPILRRSLPVFCFFLTFLVLFSAGCSSGGGNDVATTTQSDSSPGASTSNPLASQAGGPLTYLEKPLIMTSGVTSELFLEATGGQPPYSWRVKAGSLLPRGFSLTSIGRLTGSPGLLAEGATEMMSDPFTVIIRDTEGTQTEVEIKIKIVNP